MDGENGVISENESENQSSEDEQEPLGRASPQPSDMKDERIVDYTLNQVRTAR
jgi:hypothetical protein